MASLVAVVCTLDLRTSGLTTRSVTCFSRVAGGEIVKIFGFFLGAAAEPEAFAEAAAIVDDDVAGSTNDSFFCLGGGRSAVAASVLDVNDAALVDNVV